MRTLSASEIECRVGTQTDTGVSLLLYKDARVDMRTLDEVYGPFNWERYHEVINGNLFCTVRVWDKEMGRWVAKQDVGTESNTEKEKGEASDSFKRACFNWGIGRELYTAPFIWVNITADDLNAKGKVKTNFVVREIGYNEQREINHLVITDSKGNPRYTFGKNAPKVETKEAPQASLALAIAEMYAATSRDQVITLWNNYKQFHKEESFKRACTEQGVKYREQ